MKISRISPVFSIVLFIGAWICSPILKAQSGGTGALTVNVNDPSGRGIAGATVKISNSGAVTRSQTTGDSGSYTFTLLPPGVYEVSISAQGFQAVTMSAVTVDVTETKLDRKSVQLGIQTEQVAVTGTVEITRSEERRVGKE